MIISRTPFRISFVGGGTDLPSFYREEGGAVISTTIDKYVYVTVKKQNQLQAQKIRISYSITENVDRVEDIKHPIVREALKMLGIDYPIEITNNADIPARTGLGSSSTFTVGLLNALHALEGEHVSSKQLAEEACHIEIERLGRPIGKQDQYAAAFGGLNHIRFNKNEDVSVSPIVCKEETRRKLFDSLLLFYTGITRDASEILEKQAKQQIKNMQSLRDIKNMTNEFIGIIQNGHDIDRLGKLLNEAWIKKKSLTKDITNDIIDKYYEKAKDAGAEGGKILGAGGGGFLLIFARKERHQEIRNALTELKELGMRYEPEGSKIIYMA